MREKYIYFLCGLAGALFAYIGKDYHPVHPIDLSNKLTLLAMASLTLSLAFGMAHIRVFIHFTSINKHALRNDEEVANHITALANCKAGKANLTINNQTRKEYTIDELENGINARTTKRDILIGKMDTWHKWAMCLIIVSHCFLVIGFLLLIVSKLVT